MSCYFCGDEIKIGEHYRYRNGERGLPHCLKCIGFMASRYEATFKGGLTKEEDEERAKALVYYILKSGLNCDDYVELIN